MPLQRAQHDQRILLEPEQLEAEHQLHGFTAHMPSGYGHAYVFAAVVVNLLQVIGVLRHKYLFKTRPRALISKPGARPKH